MDTEEIFKKLKKQNGEKFAQIIRGDEEHDYNLCGIPNIVHMLEFAGKNPEDAKMLRGVIKEIYLSREESQYHTDLDPLTLLDKAGYKAWYVNNKQEQNAIGGYFRSQKAVDYGMTGGTPRTNVGSPENGELLCTVYQNLDSGLKRFDDHYIIHAVKKTVFGDDKLPEDQWHIKPSSHPEREDKYGTSVISIQIPKPNGGSISIKNRYNHTVNNPDATFNNNPDNIIPGLTNSLQKHFNVTFNTTRNPLPNNFRMVHDQFVYFDQEINNTYFGPDYYFYGSNITKLKDNGSQILFYRGFMLDISKNNSHIKSIADAERGLCKELDEYIQGKTVRVTVAKDKTKTVLLDGERFMDIKDGIITFIHAPTLDSICLHKDGAKLSGNLDFSAVKKLDLKGVDLSGVTNIKFNPNADTIIIGNYFKAPGNLDFSGVRVLSLNGANLKNAPSIKFNSNGATLDLSGAKLSGNLDCSGIKTLILYETDFTNVKNIKFNPNAYKIETESKLKLSGDVDFSGVSILNLPNADCDDITSIKFNPDANTIIIGDKLKLHGDLDFSRIGNLTLNGADLTKVNRIIFNPNMADVDWVKLSETKLFGDLDFSKIVNLSLDNCDLTNVTSMKFNPKAGYIGLKSVKLSGNLDFSGVTQVNLENSDLTKVSSITFNPKGERVAFGGAKLSGDLDLSGIRYLVGLSHADFTKVTSIKIDSRPQVDLDEVDLYGKLAFSNIRELSLKRSDLTKVSGITIHSVQQVHLIQAKICGNLFLDDVKNVDFRDTDLTHVGHVKINSVQKANFKYAILSGILDLSTVQEVVLTDADLSHVRSIKFNPTGVVTGLKPKDKFRFALINGVHNLKMKFAKTDHTLPQAKTEQRKM